VRLFELINIKDYIYFRIQFFSNESLYNFIQPTFLTIKKKDNTNKPLWKMVSENEPVKVLADSWGKTSGKTRIKLVMNLVFNQRIALCHYLPSRFWNSRSMKYYLLRNF